MVRHVAALVAVLLLLHCTNAAIGQGRQQQRQLDENNGSIYDWIAAAASVVMVDEQTPSPEATPAPTPEPTPAPESIECVLCQGFAIPVNVSDPPAADANDGWKCIVDSHQVYELIGLPANFTQDLQAHHSATTLLSISSALLNQDNIFRQSTHTRSIQIQSGANLTKTWIPTVKDGTVQAGDPTGQHTLRVVRVSDNTGDAPMSASDLEQAIFTDSLNLRNQYQACSGNKLEFVSAGIVELTLTQTVANVARSTVAEWAADEFHAQYGDYSQWTHVMYVLPSSVNFGKAAAYAFVGNGLSVFSNSYVSDLLVLMHEIGHNLRKEKKGKRQCVYLLCVYMLIKFSLSFPFHRHVHSGARWH